MESFCVSSPKLHALTTHVTLNCKQSRYANAHGHAHHLVNLLRKAIRELEGCRTRRADFGVAVLDDDGPSEIVQLMRQIKTARGRRVLQAGHRAESSLYLNEMLHFFTEGRRLDARQRKSQPSWRGSHQQVSSWRCAHGSGPRFVFLNRWMVEQKLRIQRLRLRF